MKVTPARVSQLLMGLALLSSTGICHADAANSSSSRSPLTATAGKTVENARDMVQAKTTSTTRETVTKVDGSIAHLPLQSSAIRRR